MKRVLSLVIALSMLLTVLPVASLAAGESGYSDVDGTSYETPVSILKALGIMSGYTDGNFHPYTTITRAEMAAVAVHMRGVFDYGTDVSIEETQYKDMDGHPAAALVAYARSMGIIDGYDDGYFYPDDPVTYEQAVKMIIGALGYDYYATASGDYPSGYLKVANQLKLTSGIGLTIGAYITRGDVAKIVYNALTVDLMDSTKYSGNSSDVTYEIIEGKNILNTYFDVEELRGTVDETGLTSLYGETSLESNEVRIGDEIFDVGSTGIANYIGYYVKFYALDSDDYSRRVIISFKIESSKSDYIKIDAENIENVEITADNYIIEYKTDKDSKSTKTAKISSTPYVVYNGVALSDFTLDDLDPDYGQVTLVENDGDSLYDVVDVLSYDIMLVLNASSSNGTVSAAYSTGARYAKLDDEDEDVTVRLIDGDGNNVSFSEIQKNTVLAVAISKDDGQTVRTAIVCNDVVNGAIKSIDGDGNYIINGTAYEAISYMKSEYTMGIGDSGNFFLTHDGRIAGFDGESKVGKNIGRFISWKSDGFGGGDIRVMCSDGTISEYGLASEVEVNGEDYTGNQVFRWISGEEKNPLYNDTYLFGKDSDSDKAGKVIAYPNRAGFLYKVNSKGDITEMTLAVNSYVSGGDNDELTVGSKRGTRGGSDDCLYYSTKYHCFHRSDNKVYVWDGTVVFTSADNYTKTSDNDIFGVTTPASMWNNQYFQYYEAYFYYIDGKEYADFAVFYDDYDVEGNSSSYNTDYGRYAMYDKVKIVDRVIEGVDSENDDVYQLVYWEGGSLRTTDFHKEKNSAGLYYRDSSTQQFWRRGDMVRTVLTDNKITAIESIFWDNSWNDPVGNEIPADGEIAGGKNSNNKYKFPLCNKTLWGNSSYQYNIKQDYYVGRISSIHSMKYLSTLDLIYDYNNGAYSGISGEPLEGDCYRLKYDSRGYIIGVENVGVGALTEGQLVLIRKNGYSGNLSCRIAENIILYDFDEVKELMEYLAEYGETTLLEQYKEIYPEYDDIDVATTLDADAELEEFVPGDAYYGDDDSEEIVPMVLDTIEIIDMEDIGMNGYMD